MSAVTTPRGPLSEITHKGKEPLDCAFIDFLSHGQSDLFPPEI